MLGLIQNDLFDLGADLAVPSARGKAERLRMLSSQVERLEHDIDTLNARLAPLTSFVLPEARRPQRTCISPVRYAQGGTDDGGTRASRRTGQRCRDSVYEPLVDFLFVATVRER